MKYTQLMPKDSPEGAICDVAGCEEPGERSISGKKVIDAGVILKDENAKKAQLCKVHYRDFKKATKKDRELDKLNW